VRTPICDASGGLQGGNIGTSKEVIGVVIIEVFNLSNFTTSATLSKHMDSIKSSGLLMGNSENLTLRLRIDNVAITLRNLR